MIRSMLYRSLFLKEDITTILNLFNEKEKLHRFIHSIDPKFYFTIYAELMKHIPKELTFKYSQFENYVKLKQDLSFLWDEHLFETKIPSKSIETEEYPSFNQLIEKVKQETPMYKDETEAMGALLFPKNK